MVALAGAGHGGASNHFLKIRAVCVRRLCNCSRGNSFSLALPQAALNL